MTPGSTDDVILFSEVQYFRMKGIWVLLGTIAVIAWYTFIFQVVLGEPLGTNPVPDIVLFVLLVIFGILFPLWFFVMRLEVSVGRETLSFRFYPMQIRWRSIHADRISGAETVTYRPLRDYGGWGIRYGRGGMAYNVSGDRGVDVRLVDGKAFMLGSQRPEELEMAVRAMHRPRDRTAGTGIS